MFDQEVHRIRLGIRALALSVWLSVFALGLSEAPSPSSRLPLSLPSHCPAHPLAGESHPQICTNQLTATAADRLSGLISAITTASPPKLQQLRRRLGHQGK
ncbi:hypothetical protein EI94DRAFT_1723862 [Lactarius quietus]|nr:hypothetical protein EI94DRAFT_1723862 [Lactarius quietus]